MMSLGTPSVPSRDEEARLKKLEELEKAKKARKLRAHDPEDDDGEDEGEVEFEDDDSDSEEGEESEPEDDDSDSDDAPEEKKKKRINKKKNKKLYKDSWLALLERLHEHRVIFISDEITEELANSVCGLIILFSKQDPTKDTYLIINSCGGKILPALAIYDTMQSVPTDIVTICFGQASSTASLILAGGEPNKRLAAPNCRIRLKRPKPVPTVPDCSRHGVELLKELLELNTRMANLYQERTRQPMLHIWNDMERGRSMSAEEAKKFGIVDHILGTSKTYLDDE